MGSKLLKSLLELIRKEMNRQGLTQVQLAQRMRLSKQTVNQLLTGEHSPRLDTLEGIAAALGVPAFTLLMSPQERAIWNEAQSRQNLHPARDELLRRLEGVSEQAAETLLRVLPPDLGNPTPESKKASGDEE